MAEMKAMSWPTFHRVNDHKGASMNLNVTELRPQEIPLQLPKLVQYSLRRVIFLAGSCTFSFILPTFAR